VVIMMMVVMVARRLGYWLGVGRRGFRLLLRFLQRDAAISTEAVSLAIRASASRASLPARVFTFRGYFHGFFHALLQGKMPHGPEHASFGLSDQFGIIHAGPRPRFPVSLQTHKQANCRPRSF
jgi:hypothetical protein